MRANAVAFGLCVSCVGCSFVCLNSGDFNLGTQFAETFPGTGRPKDINCPHLRRHRQSLSVRTATGSSCCHPAQGLGHALDA
mmetsp:Transcript_70511/g.200029  ORF Transcript_70511/g.200029 Transcript_70511/m.200029 type:complete len:82 (+) Transcript_70511:1594-1839(+)